MIKKIKAFFKHFDISAGWFKYIRFRLFSITIGDEGSFDGFIIIFRIQIAKLLFMISYNL
jgi:hypothetical protein